MAVVEDIKAQIKSLEERSAGIKAKLYPKEHDGEIKKINEDKRKAKDERRKLLAAKNKQWERVEEVDGLLKQLEQRLKQIRGPEVEAEELYSEREIVRGKIQELQKLLKIKCYACGGMGHLQRDCPQNPQQPQPQPQPQPPHPKTCYACGIEGHLQRDCIASVRNCRACGSKGHYARVCPEFQTND